MKRPETMRAIAAGCSCYIISQALYSVEGLTEAVVAVFLVFYAFGLFEGK